MKHPIIEITYKNEFVDFVNYWSELYFYEFSDKYNSRIKKEIFSEEDLSELYFWKNGMRLSGPKLNSFNVKILAKLEIINNFKISSNFKIHEFHYEFREVSFVWQIFLLHLIKPNEFPIYDQHIHRAFLYLNNLDWSNIGAALHPDLKAEFYFKTYLPFINKNNKIKIKMIDEAMFTFGKFINTDKQYKIFNS